MPTASPCSTARRHPSAWLATWLRREFSPFAPLTIQLLSVEVSPIAQPARCRRAKDSLIGGKAAALGMAIGSRAPRTPLRRVPAVRLSVHYHQEIPEPQLVNYINAN